MSEWAESINAEYLFDFLHQLKLIKRKVLKCFVPLVNHSKLSRRKAWDVFVVDGSILTLQMASPAWPIPLLTKWVVNTGGVANEAEINLLLNPALCLWIGGERTDYWIWSTSWESCRDLNRWQMSGKFFVWLTVRQTRCVLHRDHSFPKWPLSYLIPDKFTLQSSLEFCLTLGLPGIWHALGTTCMSMS